MTFTIEQAPSIPPRGRRRSALRQHLESMRPREVLKARGALSTGQVYNAAFQCRPMKFRICKVDGGFDIYRIS